MVSDAEADIGRRIAAEGLPAVEDFLSPLRISGRSPVGVGLVVELRPVRRRSRPGRWLVSILRSPRAAAHRRHHPQGLAEIGGQLSKLGAVRLKPVGVPQEVLGAGVFIESANQVTDRVEKAVLAAGRRV